MSNNETKVSTLDVAFYIKDNPDFFIKHPELLLSLQLPHECGDAVSLLEKQADLLRDERKKLTHRLNLMVETSRENEQHYEKLHLLILALIHAKTVDAVFHEVFSSLSDDFGIDMSLLYLNENLFPKVEAKDSEKFKLMLLNEKAIDGLIQAGPDLQNTSCCILDSSPSLHSINDSHKVHLTSCAWAVLAYQNTTLGVMIMGSEKEKHFHAELDTFFLSKFTESLSVKLFSFV